MFSPFMISPLKTPYPITPPPSHQQTHLCFLLHAFPYTGESSLLRTKGLYSHWWPKGHTLLHMQLEPWVPPGVFIGWWLSLWELWGYWLVYIVVLSTGLQAHSALLVFYLLHWGRRAQFNGWLRESTSIFLRHWHSFSGDSYMRLWPASTSWHRQ